MGVNMIFGIVIICLLCIAIVIVFSALWIVFVCDMRTYIIANKLKKLIVPYYKQYDIVVDELSYFTAERIGNIYKMYIKLSKQYNNASIDTILRQQSLDRWTNGYIYYDTISGEVVVHTINTTNFPNDFKGNINSSCST